MANSLAGVGVGIGAVVTATSPELDALTRQRLIHQGLLPGAPVTVLQRTSGGGRIVVVGGSRVALDPAVVRGISVDVLAPSEADA